MNLLLDTSERRDLNGAKSPESMDNIVDRLLWYRGTRGDANRGFASKPLVPQLGAIGADPISRRRFEFELLLAPTTRISSTTLASSRKAVCRFCVA